MFWDVWIKDYLPTLLTRSKWQHQKENIQIGDFVMIVDPNQDRTIWKTGKVIEIFKGKDNLVRVVTVKTKEGEYARPVHRVCKLPSIEEIGV